MREAALLRDTDRVRSLLTDRIGALTALSQSDGIGVECLFAGLFASTLRRLVTAFDRLDDPAFAYLTVLRFFDLYEDYVARPASGERGTTAAQWRRYAVWVRRLDMASPIGAHLWLISLGARAHTRHDLAEAVCLAAHDYRRAHGRGPDLAAARPVLLGPHTSQAFLEAALEYIDLHRRQRRGWRRLVLGLYASCILVTRPLWLGVFQSWRRSAWRDATAMLSRSGAGIAPPRSYPQADLPCSEA